MGWWESSSSKPLPFFENLREDIVAHVPPGRRRMGRWKWLATAIGIVLFSSGFHAGLAYRFAHSARARLGIPGKLVSALVFSFGRHWYGCALAPTARIYGGLILPHPQGIVVGPDTIIGPRAWIFQNVTFGGMPGKSGMPRVGADARIFTGAVIVGPISVGDGVMIGANSVVAHDLPDRAVVRAPRPVITEQLD